MPIDPWLPVGLTLGNGARTRLPLLEGPGWQILGTDPEGRALLVHPDLLGRWIGSGLAFPHDFQPVASAQGELFHAAFAKPSVLSPVSKAQVPRNREEALAFARSLRRTREADPDANLADALYVEGIGRLLPTYTPTGPLQDILLLGQWLTGAPGPADDFPRLSGLLDWMDEAAFEALLQAAGCASVSLHGAGGGAAGRRTGRQPRAAGTFRLHGRPALEQLFQEHVLDVIENAERYRAFGITFPGALILHGPPGCGKTFAVERLIEHLGWASFSMNAATIGSPFIHETSRRIAALFEEAARCAPAVLVIDEMEAFLADRERGSDNTHHRVEEVAELLQRIPRAATERVLTIGMTNRLHMIDSALLRRGRFDHIVEVGMPGAQEVQALLTHLLEGLPTAPDLDLALLGKSLAGRALSDAAFLVRESARLAARAGSAVLTAELMQQALQQVLSRGADPSHRPIGFT
jgi:hypothetical protein